MCIRSTATAMLVNKQERLRTFQSSLLVLTQRQLHYDEMTLIAADIQQRRRIKQETTNMTSDGRAAVAACTYTRARAHTHTGYLRNTSRNNRPLVRRDSTLSGITANTLTLLGKRSDWLDRSGRRGGGGAYCTSRRVPGLARHFGLREGDDFRPLTQS